MGFYHPAVLVKDAQRHGLRVLPIDVNKSEWDCTVENGYLRLGLRYARGLNERTGSAVAAARPFRDVEDLAKRVPLLHKDELERLAFIGALHNIGARHRRDALWQVARAGRPAGPLVDEFSEIAPVSPLAIMDARERIAADYQGTGEQSVHIRWLIAAVR